jgi:hypothetical protein
MEKGPHFCIIGKAPSSRMLAPFGAEGVEIWSLSDNYNIIPKWDRWFELHDPLRFEELFPQHFSWLCQDHGDRPIYIQKAHPRIKNGVPYPKDEIIRRYGSYVNNSISWMVLLAIDEILKVRRQWVRDNGLEESIQALTDGSQNGYLSKDWIIERIGPPGKISLFGVDMAQTTGHVGTNQEYQHQRPSVESHIGIAQGLGIEWYVPPEADIMKCDRLYAFDSHRGAFFSKIVAREAELSGRVEHHNRQRLDAEQAGCAAAGALTEIRNMAPHLQDYPALAEYATRRMAELQQDMKGAQVVKGKQEQMCNMIQGALEDLKWVRQFT